MSESTSGGGSGAHDDHLSRTARVTLVGKPGCHLCEDARVVIEQVCSELGETFVELSILEHPDLADQYWELIPVVLVDGAQHDFYRVDPVRLRAALARAH
ncbi:unannotated protein [freshwater metagenome]|uniref:Unannotated protein n=1 Tax=freshwater metagenome TaxID=449393 RepID=A0A6J7ILU1_9ZZZZ|nr:glutaredoxin family protein [Actinomycetota bacterium]